LCRHCDCSPLCRPGRSEAKSRDLCAGSQIPDKPSAFRDDIKKGNINKRIYEIKITHKIRDRSREPAGPELEGHREEDIWVQAII
jgi:hypothetical protein